MFDILEADIVCMQETKIQRKDLKDDMVLVPGWDCFFSLPKHKKGTLPGYSSVCIAYGGRQGYSGVAIYTRQSKCGPIRAEEGITGHLACPNSTTLYRELPPEKQIGGYPTPAQLSQYPVDAVTLDSEGRCVILEFPAFVLIGVYSPANRDDTRDDFRLGFVNALDARVRNLVAAGKQVVLTGDLNISREEIDAAHAEEAMKKREITSEDFVSTPARRIFNQLLIGGRVIGERDEGREEPVLWDICRGFNEGRKGMYTCWEQKINARPGNYGARIDYVLCSLGLKDWFCESNIQEGLVVSSHDHASVARTKLIHRQGSDHCPVYATMKDDMLVDGRQVKLCDLMNPPGAFQNGQRLRDLCLKDSPPLSGRLITEFDRRRNIRDMFARKPSSSSTQPDIASASNGTPSGLMHPPDIVPRASQTATTTTEKLEQSTTFPNPSQALPTLKEPSSSIKRSASLTSTRPFKRTKSDSKPAQPQAGAKGQQSLKGFFTAKSPPAPPKVDIPPERPKTPTTARQMSATVPRNPTPSPISSSQITPTSTQSPKPPSPANPSPSFPSQDPIVAKESWSKLFSKPLAPRCESHDEPCISLLTKKPGINCGRSFWMCSRPLGPTGQKERGTNWRCGTFIWCSDWDGGAKGEGEG